jgi:hypothetical protein
MMANSGFKRSWVHSHSIIPREICQRATQNIGMAVEPERAAAQSTKSSAVQAPRMYRHSAMSTLYQRQFFSFVISFDTRLPFFCRNRDSSNGKLSLSASSNASLFQSGLASSPAGSEAFFSLFEILKPQLPVSSCTAVIGQEEVRKA